MTNKRSIQDFKSAHAPDPEVVHLRQREKDLLKQIEAYKTYRGEERVLVMMLEEAIRQAEPRPIVYTKPAKKKIEHPVTHVGHLTDLHFGEVIEPNEVEGINEFNPDIARKRFGTLATNWLAKAEAARGSYQVPKLHLIGTADYISGDIHRELSVTNAYPCPVQSVECGYAIGEMIMTMAPHYQEIEVDLLCLDNHGRMTAKPQVTQGGLNNWSYVVAHVVSLYTRNQPNVKVNIHTASTMLLHIGPEKYLCMHGHQLRGWAGIPYYGFDRRVALEAIKRQNVPEHDLSFTKMLTGHFHASMNAPYWMIGGSLSGTNAYDHSNGRHMRAHQTAWFIHPEHGEFDWARWWL